MVISSQSGRWPRGQAGRGWYRGCARKHYKYSFCFIHMFLPPSLISLLVESSWVQSHRGERPFHQVGPILFCFCSSQDLVVFHLNYALCISGWRAHNLWRSLSYKPTLSWKKQLYCRIVILPGMVIWVSLVYMCGLYVHSCTYTCMCALVCFVYMGRYEHACICMILHMGVCLYVCVYTCVYVPVHVSLCVHVLCTCACMHVYICIDSSVGSDSCLLIGQLHWENQRLCECIGPFHTSTGLKYH